VSGAVSEVSWFLETGRKSLIYQRFGGNSQNLWITLLKTSPKSAGSLKNQAFHQSAHPTSKIEKINEINYLSRIRRIGFVAVQQVGCIAMKFHFCA
jgi:hypothetical protein